MLELGPGGDLGTGALLLGHGARTYTAVDVNPLAYQAPPAFHERVVAALREAVGPSQAAAIGEQLRRCLARQPDRLRFLCEPTFDITAAGAASQDVVVSQAAFEHFDNPERVIEQLAVVARPGALLVAQVDLKTHAPRLRRWDPLSIYRVPDRLYRAWSYPGCPNRVRPREYRAMLERHGWTRVELRPTRELPAAELEAARAGLDSRFRDARSDMGWLGMMMLATRAGEGERT